MHANYTKLMNDTYGEGNRPQYLIIKRDTAVDLARAVNELLEDSYIVIGPAQVHYYQLTMPGQLLEQWHQTLVHKSSSQQVYA